MPRNIERDFQKLISRSRYSVGINHLLANQDLGRTTLQERGRNDIIQPNCFGTIVYLLGAKDKVEQVWQEAGNKINDTSKDGGDWVVIPDKFTPGYVGSKPMELFLKTLKRGRSLDGVISLHYTNTKDEHQIREGEFMLQHTALFLGMLYRRNVVFHQIKEGGDFGIGFLRDYVFAIPNYRKTRFDMKNYANPGFGS